MRSRENLTSIFLTLLIVSVLVFVLGRTGVFSFLEVVTKPVQQSTFNIFQFFAGVGRNQEVENLKKENSKLFKKLADQEKLKADLRAFRDQFETERIKTSILLPSNVVGMKGFIPNLTPPENLILDKGKVDGVKVNDIVLYQDNIIGKVSETSESLSKVLLVTSSTSSFAGKTESGILGIVKGQGSGEMIFQNVLLSETLTVGELVLTSGDSDLSGRGIIPNLIVGKIVSVEKNPSDLFQRGRLQSFIDYSKLSKVFIVRGLQ